MPPRIPYYRPRRAPRNMCRYVCVVTQSEICRSRPACVSEMDRKSGALYTTKHDQKPTVVGGVCC